MKVKYHFIGGFILGVVFSICVGSLIFFYANKYYYDWIYTHQVIKIGSGEVEEGLISKIKKEILALPLQVASKWDKLDRVGMILQNQFYDLEMIDFDKMTEDAIKGFVSAVGDPFTVYLTKQENSNFKEELKGTQDFEGIGAVVTKVEEGVMIEQILKGYPAYKNGLRPLDIIIKIDGHSTKNMSLTEAVSKIRGPAGTEVNLTIYRPSENKVFDVKIKREKIVVPSVTYEIYTLTGEVKVGYVNISIIGEDTENTLKNILNELKKQGIKGLILDLRGNGGGFLDKAVEIASHFVPAGRVIVRTKYRIYPEEEYKSYGYGGFQGYPIVVLVDKLTASAAEIISAALREDIGAKLVGTDTFGKCTIQTMKQFSDGSSLKYTIGKWFTPNGESVCSGDSILPGKGLKPDIYVKFDKDKFSKEHIDTQLERAKQVLLIQIKGK